MSGLSSRRWRWGAWRLAALMWRKEGANGLTIVANALILPACVIYSAFMLAPEDFVARQRWVIGGLVLSLGAACLNQVYVCVVVDRLQGARALLRTLPIRVWQLVAAYLSYGAVLALLMGVVGALVLKATGLATVSWLGLWPVVAISCLCGLSLASLGLLVGEWAPDYPRGDLVANLGGIFLVLVSPVLFPVRDLAPLLRPIAFFSPYTHAARLLSLVANGRAADGSSIAALIVIAASAISGAVMLFRPNRS